MGRFEISGVVRARSANANRVRSAQAAVILGLTAALVAVGSTTAYAAGLPTGPSVTGLTGDRPNGTRYSFSVADRVQASVDVGTGNLNVAADLLDLPGVSGRQSIAVSYNSRDTGSGSGAASAMEGPSWTWGLAGAGSLSLQPNGTTVDYTAADGAVWPFNQSGGIYTSPAGLKAVMTKTQYGYTLMFLQSSAVVSFNLSGDPVSVADRNGNSTAIAIGSSTSATVTSTAGSNVSPTNSARIANLSYSTYQDYGGYTYYGTTVAQASGGSTRSAYVSQGANGAVIAVTDPTGGQTKFAYSNGLVSQITNPNGATTSFTYDSSRRVVRVDQSNTTSGSAGTSTTRFSYASATSTQIAGPDTDTATAMASGAHATYTLDANAGVTAVTDAAGRQRATGFNANLDVTSATTGAAGGPSSATTTYGYDSATNGGKSLTSVTGQGGAKSTAAYGNTAASSQYLPSSTVGNANTTGSSNTSSYTYNGAGNQLTATGNTTSGSTAAGTAVTSTVTRNASGDGLIATATAPGNGSNATVYSYSNHQLAGVTPVTGSSLGSRAYTYDDFGRLRTQTDGAGNTTTYGYDKDDRLLTTAFSDSTATVMNTFDAAGNLTKQVSGGGTITNTYDQLNQLTSTANTAGGGTISYGYDKAGNQTSISDTRGTTTETFDAAGAVTSTTYPKGSGTATTNYAIDSNGHRTDTWLQANATDTVWQAHVHQSYDASGRVSRVQADLGPASSATHQMDVYYCYNSAGSGTSCGTATGTDMSKLQWTYNTLTGQTTKFTYDGMGRLTKVAESGGSGSNDTYAYTYDARGNRLTANVTGTDTSSQTLTYNAANQITSSGYSYDGAGNLTAAPGATYSYNAAEQMTSATVGGVTSTYTYAGAAQNAVLSETVSSGNSYKIAYGKSDPQGNPEIAQYKVQNLTAYVEQDPVTGQPIMLHTSSDIAALYVYDGTGSPVGLLTDFHTSSFQYTYDPYGLAVLQQTSGGNGVGQNPYAFKSGVQDRTTGFVKFGQRWYNPTTGTWTQQDTLDAPLDAANANRYAYAGDDPINNIDPSGAETALNIILDCVEHGTISAVLGLIAGPEDAAASAIVGCAASVLVDVLRNNGHDALC